MPILYCETYILARYNLHAEMYNRIVGFSYIIAEELLYLNPGLKYGN